MESKKKCGIENPVTHIRHGRALKCPAGDIFGQKTKGVDDEGGGIVCTFDISLAAGARALCLLLLLYNSLNTHLHIRGRPRPLKNGLPLPPVYTTCLAASPIINSPPNSLIVLCGWPLFDYIHRRRIIQRARTKIHNYSYHMTWWSTHTHTHPAAGSFTHLYSRPLVDARTQLVSSAV